MTRRLTFLSLSLLLIAGAITVIAADDAGATCAVNRSCEKTDTGMRCTVKAEGDTEVAKLRECVRAHAAEHHKAMDGVTTTFEDVDGGVVVVATAANAQALQALHARVETCTKDHAGCCAAAKDGHHAAAHAGCCAKATAAASPHEGCTKGTAAAAAAHEGCAKATAAAAAHEGCTKPKQAAHPDCAHGTKG